MRWTIGKVTVTQVVELENNRGHPFHPPAGWP